MKLKLIWIAIPSLSAMLLGCSIDPKIDGQEADGDSILAATSSYLESLGLTDTGEEIVETKEGEEVTAESLSEAEPEEDNLSTEAKAVLTKVKSIHENLRSQARSICSRDESLHEAIKTETKAVLENTDLSREERHDQIKDIFEGNKEALSADYEALKTCKEDNKDSLMPIREKEREIAEACLLKPQGYLKGSGIMKNHSRKDGMKENRRRHKKPPFSEERLASFEEKLLSTECSEVVASYEDKEE